MGLRGDFHACFGVLFPFEHPRLSRGYRRTDEELRAGSRVLEKDGAIGIRMDVFLHPVRNTPQRVSLQAESDVFLSCIRMMSIEYF